MYLNAYNLIILLGAVHGLVLSALLLLSRRNRRVSNVLLALMLIFYTLPVLKVALIDIGFFGAYDLWILSIESLYGLGPSLYLYARTVTDSKYTLSRVDLLHFAPVLIELGYYLSPYSIIDHHRIVFPTQDAQHLLWIVEQAGGVVSILIYLGLTNRLLWGYTKWLKASYSQLHKRALIWLRRPVVLYSVFFLVWLALRAIDVWQFGDSMGMGPYYPLLIFLSLSTYWIGTKGFLETQGGVSGFSEQSSRPELDSDDDALLRPIYKELTEVMARDRLYLDNDLSLTGLAVELDVNSRLLSRAINLKADKNFYDFINQYRVDEFKRQVGKPDAPKRLIDVAFACGFNSKATFNHVFKKSTGLTPSEYRKKLTAMQSHGM